MSTTGLFGRGVPAALSIVLAGCGPEDTRAPGSCDKGFDFDGSRIKAELAAADRFGLSFERTKYAIRSIEQSVEQYMMQWSSLCQDVEAGRVSQASYASETAVLRERMNRLQEMAIKLEHAQTAEQYEIALRSGYVAASDGIAQRAAPKGVGAKVRVLARRPGVSAPTVAPQGAVLATGTKLNVAVELDAAAHVYMHQLDAKGELSRLFPRADLPGNPLPAGTVEIPPSNEGAFVINAEDLGIEELHIVVSPDPIGRFDDPPEGDQFERVDCRARGLEYAAFGCAGTRALVYESSDAPSFADSSSVGGISYDATEAVHLTYTFHHVARHEDYGVRDRSVGDLESVRSARPPNLQDDFDACPGQAKSKEMPTADQGFERWCVDHRGDAVVDHGPYRKWGADGRLSVSGQFAKGRRVGRWRYWKADGALARESDYGG